MVSTLVVGYFLNHTLLHLCSSGFRTNDDNDEGIPVDEYHFCQYLGKDLAKSRFTEPLVDSSTKNKISLILLPKVSTLSEFLSVTGAFQTLDDDPYVSGLQESYLEQAIGWARNNSLKFGLICMVLAGSQNGFDNSGLRDSYKFLEDSNLAVTTNVLNYILKKEYSAEEYLDTVIGIELINEPLGPVLDMDKMKNDYLAPAYEYLRNNIKSDQVIIIHDAFQPYNYWDDFMTENDGYWGVTIDHHHYQVFASDQLERSIDEHIKVACEWGTGVLNESHWTVSW